MLKFKLRDAGFGKAGVTLSHKKGHFVRKSRMRAQLYHIEDHPANVRHIRDMQNIVISTIFSMSCLCSEPASSNSRFETAQCRVYTTDLHMKFVFPRRKQQFFAVRHGGLSPEANEEFHADRRSMTVRSLIPSQEQSMSVFVTRDSERAGFANMPRKGAFDRQSCETRTMESIFRRVEFSKIHTPKMI